MLRAQGHGRIIQVTSEGGVRAFPGIGGYHASKWAVEGLSESLRKEVTHFGIDVVCLEPGPYATDFGGNSGRTSAEHPDYAEVRAVTEIVGTSATPRRRAGRSWSWPTPTTRRPGSSSARRSSRSRPSTRNGLPRGGSGSRSRWPHSVDRAQRTLVSGTSVSVESVPHRTPGHVGAGRSSFQPSRS
ncbi:SDR family NAD(P)-dependent oxidoreductase [Streptosporangium lutulentum]